MFLQNSWYIVAEPSEVHNGVLARTILNEAIVLYRSESGRVVALEDRCPHRLVPLSLGSVMGENLRCGYHGAQFAPDGQCVQVPGQKAVAKGVRVRSFPIVERHGYYWIWMGDPSLCSDESTIPDGYWMSAAEGWHGAYGHFKSMKVDYRLLNDNVIDITHAEFVHPESFGGQEVQFFRNARQGDGYLERGMSFNINKNSIHFRFTASNMEAHEGAPVWWQMIADSRAWSEFKGDVHFAVDVDWWAPCYTSFSMGARPADEPDAPMARICNLHAAIPETETTTHYFYRSVRDYGDPNELDAIKQVADFIFGQDKPVLEAQQKLVGMKDLFDHKPISFSGDRLPIEARKILKRLIDDQIAVRDVA